MKTHIALHLDDGIVEVAKREAERQNRSFANLVETVLSESLLKVSGDSPIVSRVDDDLAGLEVLGDSGQVDMLETEKLEQLIAIARRDGDG
jgi:hypothetical protein